MEGWVKLHRKFKNWEWYGDSKTVHLFIHLLLSANREDGEWNGVKVKRGQVIVSRRKLSKILGMSERSIRTCLERLKATHETTHKTTQRYTLVTIANYNNYQRDERKSGPLTDPQNDHKQEVENKKKKYKKEKSSTKGATAPPSPFVITEAMESWFDGKGFSSVIDIEDETERMVDWAKSKGVRRKDWTATWRNWVKKAVEFKGGTKPEESEWL